MSLLSSAERRFIEMRRSNSRFAADAELNKNNSQKLIRESLVLILDDPSDVPALCVPHLDHECRSALASKLTAKNKYVYE